MRLLDKIKKLFNSESIDFQQLIRDGAIVVDVRSVQEFNLGHLKGSENYPIQLIKSKIGQLKDKKVVIVCRSGTRASMAKRILKTSGITAYNAGAWQNLS